MVSFPPTPLAAHEKLSIGGVRPVTLRIRQLEIAEFTVGLHATYDNPFDAADVALDALIIGPDGRRTKIPGFFYRPFSRLEKNGKEVLTADGPPSWRVRICPEKAGKYRLLVIAHDRTGEVSAPPLTFLATRSTAEPGFVGLSHADPHYFAFSNGTPYFPVGSNTAWGGDPGTFNYDQWFAHYGANGANYGRLWLGPHWSTFALDTPGKNAEGRGFGYFDLANLWRLDYVLGLARKNGIYLMLTLDSYNTLRDRDAYPQWENTPLNRKNGGPIDKPSDYWTSPEIRAYYRNRLRYLIARYSADSHVMAWEFWNEVDLTRDFQPATVTDWHRDMARQLKALDPYRHLVTTSFSNSLGVPEIDRLPELDYIQTHLYTPNFEREATLLNATKFKMKAHYVGEVGADGGGPRAEDKAGLQLHDALWSGIANPASGTAMMWWWDNLIAPNDQYRIFKPAARFAKSIDWPHEKFTAARPELRYADPKLAEGAGDLELVDGPTRMGNANYNRPQDVTVQDSSVSGDLPLAGLLHGTRNHPDLHNPVTFSLDRNKPTELQILIGDVSGWGGAKLRVSLDGQPLLEKDFTDPDDTRDTTTLTQYRQTVTVPVPAGRHTVRIENTGNDWISVGYRFKDLISGRRPPIVAEGVVGVTRAILWLRSKEWNFHDVVERKREPELSPATQLILTDLKKGQWRAELFEPWTGESQNLSGAWKGGRFTIAVPSFHRDVVVKLVRLGG